MKKAGFFENLGLDKKDRRIMYELDANARQSNAEIAKKVGLDKNVVNYRINRLIERNFIEGFYTIIDTARIGFEGFRFYIKFQYVEQKKEKEIIDFVVESPLSWWVGSIDGKYGLGFLLWVRDVYELKEFWEKFLKKFRDFVQEYTVCVYTGLVHFPYAFLCPERIEEVPMQAVGSKEKSIILRKDEAVLKVLANNARAPTVEIAKRASLSAMQVKHSIKKLKKEGVIKGFRTHFNLEKLGYTYYKVDFNLKDISGYKRLLNYARAQPNIIYVDQTIGAGDFEPNLLVRNHTEFQKVMNDMHARFPGLIKDYTYVLYSGIHKILYYQEPV